MKNSIITVSAVILLGIAAFCLFMIYQHYTEEAAQIEVFEELYELINQPQTDEDNNPISDDETECTNYGNVYLQNTDMVGWIKIEGTTINYPVMQTIDNPNYYIKRNFYREYSNLGVPYIQENCDLETSNNIIIYGHHIKGGKMFGALESYKTQSFYTDHKVIQFDTLSESAEYEIIAVFRTVAYSASGFRYYDFVNAEDESSFDAYVNKCKELSFYDAGVTAEYGDRLITLSTCEYSSNNGRLVVVAKRII